MPLSWIVALLLLSLFTKSNKFKKRTFQFGLGLLLIFSNQFLAIQVMKSWEMEYISSKTLNTHDIGIVLSGIAKPSRQPYDRPELNKGADRLLHAIRLYHQGKIRKILITGGKASIHNQDIIPESEVLQDVAISFGVCKGDLLIENKANNTYQNALFTKQLLDKHALNDKKLLLITSAFHMRRAKACFDKQDVRTTVFPTDYNTSPVSTNPTSNFYPSTNAFLLWDILIKEIVGTAIYSLKGYL